jgi:hypothetical protein
MAGREVKAAIRLAAGSNARNGFDARLSSSIICVHLRSSAVPSL